MTRIAFVTDIHGNLAALDAVIRDIACRGVDRVVNLGDSLSGPLLPAETAERLRASGWFHLAGNHERQILTDAAADIGASDAHARSTLSADALAWIAAQAPMAWLTPDVYLCHGTPRSDIEHCLESVDGDGLRAATLDEVEERIGPIDAGLIVCGHSHVPRVVRTRSGQLVVNPGSVGLQAYRDDRPFAYAVENRSPDARYAIAERGAEGWVTALVAVPYDFEPMARLAERRDRAEWAMALRTGTMPR